MRASMMNCWQFVIAVAATLQMKNIFLKRKGGGGRQGEREKEREREEEEEDAD